MMPAISFSTLKEKLLSGEKKQTIRWNNPKTNYWLQFEEKDRLIGFWKMRTKECEKIFDSFFSEDVFLVKYPDIIYDDALMIRDGFKSAMDAYVKWFYPHYGSRVEGFHEEFVVIRWV